MKLVCTLKVKFDLLIDYVGNRGIQPYLTSGLGTRYFLLLKLLARSLCSVLSQVILGLSFQQITSYYPEVRP